jgi:hypothetical protein
MFAAPKCSKCSPGELNGRCSHRFFMSLGRCKPQSQSCSHEVSTICLMSNIEDSFWRSVRGGKIASPFSFCLRNFPSSSC